MKTLGLFLYMVAFVMASSMAWICFNGAEGLFR